MHLANKLLTWMSNLKLLILLPSSKLTTMDLLNLVYSVKETLLPNWTLIPLKRIRVNQFINLQTKFIMISNVSLIKRTFVSESYSTRTSILLKLPLTGFIKKIFIGAALRDHLTRVSSCWLLNRFNNIFLDLMEPPLTFMRVISWITAVIQN